MKLFEKPGCLLMAAGNSIRFGGDKLDACFGGKSLLQRSLESIPADVFSSITAVVQKAEAARLAASYGFCVLLNEKPEKGISRTIRLGTEAMQSCPAILYMTADQPLLTEGDVRQVVSVWQAHPDCIVSAAHNGRRGSPCIFPARFFPELLALEGDTGGSAVLRAHPEALLLAEVREEALFDCDTPEALEALRAFCL